MYIYSFKVQKPTSTWSNICESRSGEGIGGGAEAPEGGNMPFEDEDDDAVVGWRSTGLDTTLKKKIE